jgi:hypothetical protein
MHPGENKNIVLTITNLGTIEDLIMIEIETGILSDYILLDNYSMLKIDTKSNGQRILNITLPKNAKQGIYEIVITAISMNSGQTEKDNHIVSIEIIESKIDTEKTDFNLLILLIILIIIIITITLLALIMNRKKRRKAESLLPGTLTVKPGALPAPVLAVGEIPSTLQVPQLHGTAAIEPSQQPIPSVTPTPMLAKTTQITQAIVLQQTPTVQVPQLPALPPAKPQDKEPEVSTTIQTPVPTVVSPPSTPTIATAPSTSSGPTVHLPESSKPTEVPPTQQKPTLAEPPQTTQPTPVISPKPKEDQESNE